MTPGRASLISQLRRILKGRTSIFGVGNTLRGDDGVGPYFASLVQDRKGLAAVDCGDAPERFIGKALRGQPDTVILADAVDFGGIPGEARLLDVALIQSRSFSTHDISLKLLVDHLTAERKHVLLLAFQPRSMRLGEGLSEDVRRLAFALARDTGILPATENPQCKQRSPS